MHQTITREVGPRGDRVLQVQRNLGDLTAAAGAPAFMKAGAAWHLKNLLRYRRRDLPKVAFTRFVGRLPGLLTMEARLVGQVFHLPAELAPEVRLRLRELLAQNVPVTELVRHFGGQVVDFGTLSTRVVTTAGVGYIVDAFQNLTELENMKYHGFGTGTTAEATGDTALVTEETTQYNPDSTRPTGSQTENGANVYRTVGTYSPDSGGTRAITEHGIFSQAATGGGVLLDRSVFSAVNLVAGSDSLQVTYDLTLTAGS